MLPLSLVETTATCDSLNFALVSVQRTYESLAYFSVSTFFVYVREARVSKEKERASGQATGKIHVRHWPFDEFCQSGLGFYPRSVRERPRADCG